MRNWLNQYGDPTLCLDDIRESEARMIEAIMSWLHRKIERLEKQNDDLELKLSNARNTGLNWEGRCYMALDEVERLKKKVNEMHVKAELARREVEE